MPNQITLGVEWTNSPGHRPFRVSRRDTGQTVGYYRTYEEGKRAMPRLARKILGGRVEGEEE